MLGPMADAPDPTVAPEATAELASRLRLSVTRLARQLRQTADSDLSPTQGSILATVSNHGPLTLGELADLERVASPTITKAISLLHDKGLVAKTTDPEDRRFVRVTLTPAGQALLERTRARKTAWLARRLADLSPDQLDQLRTATELLEDLTTRPR
jgi:DNA-binding MarR family transcriptional regulator